MTLPKHYNPQESEPKWQTFWNEKKVFAFSPDDSRPVYAIDTPLLTVSGDPHLGHCYSYSQTDFMARFWRMQGHNVFYPMGWDNHGLSAERLVEEYLDVKPGQVGKDQFILAIQEVSRELEHSYEWLWKRLGFSVHWKYTYSTISAEARKVSQHSFIDLFNRGLAYRTAAPSIWCPECKTAVAQAETSDLQRETDLITFVFGLPDGSALPIASTRPELLPACVAVFVHPQDTRYAWLVGQWATTPLFQQEVPILADPGIDPEKGTGAVMCCTFGDSTDIEWWHEYNLPLKVILDKSGRLTEEAGTFAGLDIPAARMAVIAELVERGFVLDQRATVQTVGVHGRCGMPVEYIETRQWFIKVIENRERLLEIGEKIAWYPPHMAHRYQDWVQNLKWDWLISRQRAFGIPFPVWYCSRCGETIVAHQSQLPVEPSDEQPRTPCLNCGSTEFLPETDVMDTWVTSSVSPQIAARWLEDEGLFKKLFPMSLRFQSHDLIRTWTFYTIVKANHHFNKLPWKSVALSGHALALDGGKLSNLASGSFLDPNDIINRYSADAVRYWSSSTRLGRDSVMSEEKMAAGSKLVTKLWNVEQFALSFLEYYEPPKASPSLYLVDEWLLSRLQDTIRKATQAFEGYDYAAAKDETEAFFWNILADNYLEMVKIRLYELYADDPARVSAQYTLYHALLTTIKLFAPFMPHITEEIYQGRYVYCEEAASIHLADWPIPKTALVKPSAELLGKSLVAIATEVRRFKTTNQMNLGAPLKRLLIGTPKQALLKDLQNSWMDIRSVTRAEDIVMGLADLELAQAQANIVKVGRDALAIKIMP